ncbi:MAG: M67 family metallopeptidase [Anaerolineales bacterium]|jgi:proteasome lid subunit RPN8/RPN11
MNINLPEELMDKIHTHAEGTYPEEGAGLLLGRDEDGGRVVVDVLPLPNSREDSARHNRYVITPQHLFEGEKQAEARGLDVIGVFHSHPDHPNRPSEFDRTWAVPWFSYIITSVEKGQAVASRSWRLTDDRQKFNEEHIVVMETVS